VSVVVPPPMRSTIEEGPGGLAVVIPARRRTLALVMLPVAVAIWGWVGYLNLIAVDFAGEDAVFRWLFLMVWLVSGASVVTSSLWSVFGRERVVADTGLLIYSYELLGFSRKFEYDAGQMKNLRYSPIPLSPWGTRDERYWRWGGGDMVFDYGSKSVRFGAVDEAEGAAIIERLTRRLHLVQSEPAPAVETVDSPEVAAFWRR